MEPLLWAYAHGKPVDRVEQGAPSRACSQGEAFKRVEGPETDEGSLTGPTMGLSRSATTG